MRIFAVLVVAGLGIVGCGYDPHPKDGRLPCSEGCPSGYECRCDNRCWQKQSDGGTCSGDARDAQGTDGRAASPEAALDGEKDYRALDGSSDQRSDAPLPTLVDGASDTGYEVPADAVSDGGRPADDGKIDALYAADSPADVAITADVAADAGRDADAPSPISTVCVADQSRFDECSFGP